MAGLGQTLFPGAVLGLTARGSEPAGSGTATQAPASAVTAFGEDAEALPTITPEMIDQAAAIAGLRLSPEQRAMMVEEVTQQRTSVVAIRKLHMENAVPPAFVFDPVPAGMVLDTAKEPMRMSAVPAAKQMSLIADTRKDALRNWGEEAIAFATVRDLAELLRTQRVSSLELTKLYLGRLKRYDPELKFVITLTEQRALASAAAADREIAAGKYRGPLHGVPWGAKDLLAVKGYPTTWGAAGFEGQSFDEDAEVVRRLDAAGAVLVAKLTMGALAQGDLWGYPRGSGKPGGRTRNPWNPRQGSSGSSAGSASAVGAGCVGFALGTETLGSISSPSTRCGVTGLRPTFGFVPRTGAMALSWTMDKIGPICRAVEDCALVMSAIHGPDGHDRTVRHASFNWNADLDWRQLKVGYIKAAFDAPAPPVATKPPETLKGKDLEEFNTKASRAKGDYARRVYDMRYNTAALAALRRMGVALSPVEIPKFPFGDIVPVLEAEGAAAFDSLTRSGRDRLLAGQETFDWPNQFRVARMYSAVDYVQAMRARMLAIDLMAKVFAGLDVIVTPSGGVQLVATNLTGQPAVIVPNGIRGEDAPRPESEEDGSLRNAGGPGTPVSLTFLGPIFSDAHLLAFARAYQMETGFASARPKLDGTPRP